LKYSIPPFLTENAKLSSKEAKN